MNHLLVIDDDPLMHVLLSEHFSGPQYAVRTAATARDALAAFKQKRPDVVLLDVNLPDLNGLKLFQALHQLDATVPVIFITASDASEVAIEAIKLGSFDYLVKPLNLKQVSDLVKRALYLRRLMTVPVAVDGGAEAAAQRGDAFVGRCPAMREVSKAIGRVAPHDVNVLIRGDSGTGKELVARAIYQHSRRASQAFMAINCAAIPEALLESELFGHEKGSFTGADRQRVGKFEQISGGTLFLDEIGDMPLPLQAKILRVLQEQQFQRVGGSETITTDVRIIAATHRDLEAAVAAERFRGDLYYRLNVFSIELPPLRERGEDLPLLIEHLVRRFSQELARDVPPAGGMPGPPRISPEVMELLQRYSWPGNVRELQSALQQAILQAAGSIILVEDLPRSLRGPARGPVPAGADASEGLDWEQFITQALHERLPDLYARALERMERTLLARVLRQTSGHQTRASDILGITRGSLRHKLRTLGMKVDQVADEVDGE